MTKSPNCFTNRADLLIAAGESIKMQTAAGIEPMCKLYGTISTIDGKVFDAPELYEFPQAVVEGKPVFVGDELYSKETGIKFTADEISPFGNFCDGELSPDNCSWNPPKPSDVTVRLHREDAESLQDWIIAKDAAQERVMNAIREALEK